MFTIDTLPSEDSMIADLNEAGWDYRHPCFNGKTLGQVWLGWRATCVDDLWMGVEIDRALNVQANVDMLNSGATQSEVILWLGDPDSTIRDGAARTIAGWWASSGSVGHVLAALSTGLPVNERELRDDIEATRIHHRTMSVYDREALDALDAWTTAQVDR